MKFVWASPYSHVSAIARFSNAVVTELRARGHEVAVYRTEIGEYAHLDPIEDYCVILPDSAEAERWLGSADIVFGNIGDHYGFHGGLFPLMDRRPVVGVLHDWCLLGLFWGWLQSRGETQKADAYIAEIYGEEASALFSASMQADMLVNSAKRFPLTEWATAPLLGAIIHAEFYRARVEAACAGPVVRVPLAYPSAQASDGRQRRPDGMLTVTTIGVVNPNKCVDRVIEAIGGDPHLCERVEYRVLGNVEDTERARLLAVAAANDFAGLVLEGAVSHERLLDALSEADIICCLRNPALEGASASAIEGMQSGAPVIVSNEGFYAELPDSMVLKVTPGREVDGVRAHINDLFANPLKREEIGKRAKAWARDEFSQSRYCDLIEAHVGDFLSAEPYLNLSRALGRELGKMGLGVGEDPVIPRVAELLERAFSSTARAN